MLVLNTLIVIWYSVTFFMFLVLGSHWNSWLKCEICQSLFLQIFFFLIYFSFPHPFLSSPLRNPFSYFRLLEVVLQITDALFIFIFMSCFSLALFKIILINVFKFTFFFKAYPAVTSIQCIFISYIIILISWCLIWVFYLFCHSP